MQPAWLPSGKAQPTPPPESPAAPGHPAAPAAASGGTAGPERGRGSGAGNGGCCSSKVDAVDKQAAGVPTLLVTWATMRRASAAAHILTLTHHRYSRAFGMGWISPSAMARCSQASPSVTASTVVGLPLLALSNGLVACAAVRRRFRHAAQPAALLFLVPKRGPSPATHQQAQAHHDCSPSHCRLACSLCPLQLGVNLRQLRLLSERRHSIALQRSLEVGHPLLRHRAPQHGDPHHHLHTSVASSRRQGCQVEMQGPKTISTMQTVSYGGMAPRRLCAGLCMHAAASVCSSGWPETLPTLNSRSASPGAGAAAAAAACATGAPRHGGSTPAAALAAARAAAPSWRRLARSEPWSAGAPAAEAGGGKRRSPPLPLAGAAGPQSLLPGGDCRVLHDVAASRRCLAGRLRLGAQRPLAGASRAAARDGIVNWSRRCAKIACRRLI